MICLQKEKKIINNQQYNQNDFLIQLKKIFFDSSESKPTFRQLIQKFVRTNDMLDNNMIKFLPTMTTNADYDSIYQFLFNIAPKNIVDKKKEILEKLTEHNRTLSALQKSKNISSLSSLLQKQKLIESEIDSLTKQRENFEYMEKYQDEINKKHNISANITQIESEMQLIDIEINTIECSIKEFNAKKSDYNFEALDSLYQEAKVYIPNLKKSFAQLVEFHNEMIQNRIDFINQQLMKKEKTKEKYTQELEILLEQKKELMIDVLDEGLLSELNLLNQQIEDLSVQKGEIIQSIKLIKEQENEISLLNGELDKIEMQIDHKEVEDKIDLFNHIFAEYSNKLYGQKKYITYNFDWQKQKGFPIIAESLGGKVGTGKKKALIAAFDLAYMEYASAEKIKAPNFVIHDKMESVFIDQIATLFNLCEKINGQYILPILRERLDKIDEKIINKATVLELNEKDKFFGI